MLPTGNDHQQQAEPKDVSIPGPQRRPRAAMNAPEATMIAMPASDQPSGKSPKTTWPRISRREHRRGGVLERADQDEVADAAQDAEHGEQQAVGERRGRVPVERQRQADQRGADERTVEERGDARVDARELPRHELVGGEAERGCERQRRGRSEHRAAGAHDDQHPGEAGRHGEPRDGGDALAQEQYRERGQQERREERDRGGLRDRHQREREEVEQRREREHRAAPDLQPGTARAQQAAPEARTEHRDHEDGLEHVPEPHDRRHRVGLRQVLRRGVHDREGRNGRDEQEDAAQMVLRAGGRRGHRRRDGRRSAAGGGTRGL